mmetsp:Transcript_63/g.210  ORF Transcript_63/g.210 Transcript_63/m.210 type:complete len:555 (+) Transcript_63:2-1666(+)
MVAAVVAELEKSLQQERADVQKLLESRHHSFLRRLEWELSREVQVSDTSDVQTSAVPVEISERISDSAHVLPGKEEGSSIGNDMARHGYTPPPPQSANTTSHEIEAWISQEDNGPELAQLDSLRELIRWIARSFHGCLSRSLSLARLKEFATSGAMEMISGGFILLNAIILATECQYEGFDNAFSITYSSSSQTAAATWPGAESAFETMEWIFGIFFALELVLRIWANGCRLGNDCACAWTFLDALVVLMWCVDRMGVAEWGVNPLLLRLLRLARLTRLLRLVRWIAIFDPLHVMIKSIKASVGILCWSMILLCLAMTTFAMVVSYQLQGYIRDSAEDADTRRALYENWGTFVRAYVSMFEITTANWGPQCWRLMNALGEPWGVFFVLYKCTFGFAVLQVITSVFVQQTFKITNNDEQVMIKEHMKASEMRMKSLDRLFCKLDKSGDGVLTWDEYSEIVTDPHIKAWFATLDVDASELEELFSLLDDGYGQIHRNDFTSAIKKVKGNARAMDLVAVQGDLRKLHKNMGSITDTLKDLVSALQEPGLKQHFPLSL